MLLAYKHLLFCTLPLIHWVQLMVFQTPKPHETGIYEDGSNSILSNAPYAQVMSRKRGITTGNNFNVQFIIICHCSKGHDTHASYKVLEWGSKEEEIPFNGNISARSCEPPSGNTPIAPPSFKRSKTV